MGFDSDFMGLGEVEMGSNSFPENKQEGGLEEGRGTGSKTGGKGKKG